MKKFINGLLVLLGAFLVGWYGYQYRYQLVALVENYLPEGIVSVMPPLGGVDDFVCATVASTTRTFTVGSGEPRMLMGTTSRRIWAKFSATTTPVWLMMANGLKGTPGEGVPIFSSSTVEINRGNLYTGIVYANAYASTSVTVQECAFE